MTIKTDLYELGCTEGAGQCDQRREYRLAGRVRVRVELESVEPGGEEEPRTIAAVSTDVSPDGLRLSLEEALPVGALLPVVATFGGDPDGAGNGQGDEYNLIVEVIWTRAADHALWQSGTRVLESSDGDYLAWMTALARAMEGD